MNYCVLIKESTIMNYCSLKFQSSLFERIVNSIYFVCDIYGKSLMVIKIRKVSLKMENSLEENRCIFLSSCIQYNNQSHDFIAVNRFFVLSYWIKNTLYTVWWAMKQTVIFNGKCSRLFFMIGYVKDYRVQWSFLMGLIQVCRLGGKDLPEKIRLCSRAHLETECHKPNNI